MIHEYFLNFFHFCFDGLHLNFLLKMMDNDAYLYYAYLYFFFIFNLI